MIDWSRTTPSRALRGAIIGYGFISERGHAPAYALPGATRFEIAAIAETCAARREMARAAFPSAHIYDCHNALLDAERGNVDFVDVSTPPSEHARIAQAALLRGYHVLCEKPLATSLEEARSMVATARQARRVLFPCHNYKHAPVVKAVRDILDAREIGRVHLVTLQTFRTTHAKGVEEWRRDWRRERRFSGGGIAMDHGSHTFYLAFDWLGAYPTAITAKMSTLGDFDTEDNFACAMTFPTGMATAHLTWTAGVRKVLYTIHGERGAVRVEDDDVEVTVMHGDKPRMSKLRIASAWMDASHVGWFRSLFDQFADAIRDDEFVSRETEASVRCVEVISSAYASALDGSLERSLPVPSLSRVA
jgi:predicted dehydrogenase